MDTQRRKVRVAVLSVASNTVLVAVKLAIGLMVGAVSIIICRSWSSTISPSF